MLKGSSEECELLDSDSVPAEGKRTKELPQVESQTVGFLTLFLLVFVAMLLYHVASRVFALSAKQEEVETQLRVYAEAANTLEMRMKALNVTASSPFSEEEYQKYNDLIKRIKYIESATDSQPAKEEKEENSPLEQFQQLSGMEEVAQEREAVLNNLVAHYKEQVRKRKIAMMDKIAKKEDFQEEKVRNPWAMGRMNLRTPFIDTLERRHMEEEVQKEIERLDEKYHFNFYSNELPICAIVTTFNNAKNFRYEYNLQSIINQNYNNYKIVIVDDASTDATPDLIEIFLNKNKVPRRRYALVRNKMHMTAVPNIYNAIKNHCSKDAIAVLISGDDELLGKLVFKVLNVVYQTKQPGLAYTNHFYGKLHENDFEKGYSRTYTLGEIKNKLYRFIGQKFGHMRTFPVSVFLEIKEEHMRYRDGRWVQATYDETFILPMLEMACDSIEYIDEYVYLYNYGTGENDGEIHHDLQSEAALYVRELPRYNCIPKYQKFVI